MRANPAEYELIAPGTLQEVVALLGSEPGAWLPVAGGTDVMVQYAAGKLAPRKWVSIGGLRELRSIDVDASEIRIGAGCTYTDIRNHKTIASELPLLTRSAAWTGGIANQNRGTMGGNIANASPAGDSLPVLLAYDAELALISARGERRIPYNGFHTGYKKSLLASDELIRAVCIPRKFAGYFCYAKKVGAREAQAISKVFLAALGRFADGKISEIRLAAGSVAPIPIRLAQTENVLRGQPIADSLLQTCRRAIAEEIRAIDDIRSTAKYRTAVLGNLVAEFLGALAAARIAATSVLQRWNSLSNGQATVEIFPCCGSYAWAHALALQRPFENMAALQAASDSIWSTLSAADWLQAFASHPRIGDAVPAGKSTRQSVTWSAQEQSDATKAAGSVKLALAGANREYERKFGRTFIICATGKSAAEILENLERRLNNEEPAELLEAAEQQQQITQLRLKKWLTE
jgi:OHCU decarboxylase